MQDGARFFAYSTWAIMISMGMMIFSYQFLFLAEGSIWGLLGWLTGFGLTYFNATYAVIKRYIKKVPAPTNLHIALAILIFLPPTIWIITIQSPVYTTEYIMLLILAVSTSFGTVVGNKYGIKARFEYVQKLKEHQQKIRNSS